MKKAVGALTLILFLIVAFGIGAKYARTNGARTPVQEHKAKSGTLAWYAETAKEKGSKEIVIPAPDVEIVTEINSIEEALDAYTVVVAEPVEKRAFADDDREILSWYRLKILDNLSRKDIHSCSECRNPSNIPLEMSTVAADEILIADYGGTVEIEGVKVTMQSSNLRQLFIGQPYLIFLSIDSPGQFATVAVGSAGVYAVGPNGELAPRTSGHHKLQELMNDLFANADGSLSLAKFKGRMKEYLKKKNHLQTE